MPTRRRVGRPRKPKSQHKKVSYKRRYKKFNTSRKAKDAKNRRARARRVAIKAGKIKKGDTSKHVHHPKGGARGKSVVVSAKYNLSRSEGSRKKGSRRNKKNRGK